MRLLAIILLFSLNASAQKADRKLIRRNPTTNQVEGYTANTWQVIKADTLMVQSIPGQALTVRIGYYFRGSYWHQSTALFTKGNWCRMRKQFFIQNINDVKCLQFR